MPLTNSHVGGKKSTSLVTVVSIFDIFRHFIFDTAPTAQIKMIYVNHTAGKFSCFFFVFVF